MMLTPELVELVKQLDSAGPETHSQVADLVGYDTALSLHEQLQRRLLEDGATVNLLSGGH